MTAQLPPPLVVLDLLPDAVCVVAAEGHFLFVNETFGRILGYEKREVMGHRAFDFVHPDDLEATLQQVKHIMQGHLQRHFRNRYRHKDGHFVDMQWSAQWHEEYGVRIAVGREVTELRKAECQLEYLATHDVLTDLPNRHHLLMEMKRATEHARAGESGLAVLYIDLDGFKPVNDRWGHEVGDAVLQEAAARIKKCSRSGDIAARVGGDEFVVLMRGCANRNDAMRHARVLRKMINAPYHFLQNGTTLDASIGVALFPEDGEDPACLLSHADKKMYQAKERHHADGTIAQ